MRQIEHARAAHRKNVLLGHAAKLAGVGRAFAMTRLVWMVRALEATRSDAEFYEALGPMLDAARDTVRLLRG